MFANYLFDDCDILTAFRIGFHGSLESQLSSLRLMKYTLEHTLFFNIAMTIVDISSCYRLRSKSGALLMHTIYFSTYMT